MDKRKKKKEKADAPRPCSKTTVAGKGADVEDFKQKSINLGNDPEVLKKRIAELETSLDQCVQKVSQREEERNKALDDLAVAQAKAAVFKSDFEEERKDRERLQHQYEELKSHEAPEFVAKLEEELERKNKECSELSDQLEEVQSMHMQDVASLEEKLLTCESTNKQIAQYYEHQLSVTIRELEEKKQEILEYNKTYSHEDEGYGKYFTLQDQLDLSEMTCKNLQRDKERADDMVGKLKQEISKLQSENTELCHERDRLLYSNKQLQRQVPHIYHGSRSCEYQDRREGDVHHEPDMSVVDDGPREVELNEINLQQIRSGVNRSASDGQVPSYGWGQCELPTNNIRDQQQCPISEANSSSTQPIVFRAHHYSQGYYGHPSTQIISDASMYPSLSHNHDQVYTKALDYISLEMGDLSEYEMTSLKDMVANWTYTQEEELDNDIKLMCDKMRGLRHENLVRRKTNLQAALDPNLICPNCEKQFREGDIQKFREHVKCCKQKF